MYPAAFNEMIDRLVQLLDERLAAKGGTLEARVKSVRKRLPRKVRHALEFLIDIQVRMENPKLALKTDASKVAAAYGVARNYLEEIKPGKFKKRARSSLLAQIAFQILFVMVLTLLVLWWRALI